MRRSELRGVVVVLFETTGSNLDVLISVCSQRVDALKCAKLRVVSRPQAIGFLKNDRRVHLDDAATVHPSWYFSNV